MNAKNLNEFNQNIGIFREFVKVNSKEIESIRRAGATHIVIDGGIKVAFGSKPCIEGEGIAYDLSQDNVCFPNAGLGFMYIVKDDKGNDVLCTSDTFTLSEKVRGLEKPLGWKIIGYSFSCSDDGVVTLGDVTEVRKFNGNVMRWQSWTEWTVRPRGFFDFYF